MIQIVKKFKGTCTYVSAVPFFNEKISINFL